MSQFKLDQKGVIPVLIVVSVVGVIALLLLTSTATFKDGVYSALYPKKASLAAENATDSGALEASDSALVPPSSATESDHLTEPHPVSKSALELLLTKLMELLGSQPPGDLPNNIQIPRQIPANRPTTATESGKKDVCYPVFDTASSSGSWQTSFKWDHTIDAGDDRLLLVDLSEINGSFNHAISVTFGGQNLTFFKGVTSNGTDTPRSEIWFLKNPPIGANEIMVTMATNQDVEGSATSWFNIDQNNPIGSSQVNSSNFGVGPNITLSSNHCEVAVDNLAFCTSGICGGAQATLGSGQNHLSGTEDYVGNVQFDVSSKVGEDGTTNLLWHLSKPRSWADVGVILRSKQSPNDSSENSNQGCQSISCQIPKDSQGCSYPNAVTQSCNSNTEASCGDLVCPGDSSATTTSPGWTICSNEFGICHVSGPHLVRFGADVDSKGNSGSFYKQFNTTGSFACGVGAASGDPAPGVSKHCDYQSTSQP